MNHYPDLAKEKECTACFACIDICAHKAITSFINAEGHYAIRIEKEKCIMCGRCEKVCIESRNDYGNNNLTLSTIYAGYTTDKQLREAATSGGVFAAIAKSIIQKGGAVVGACFDGSYAKHILIDDILDISRLQGSKYTPSSMEGIYRVIQEEIKNRIVLFSGTGCQVGAILSYFRNNPHRENLFTIDLVCGGVPSTALISKFNAYYNNQYKICTFRKKDKYELTVMDSDKKTRTLSSKAMPLGGFSCEMTNRYSCYDCKFAFCHRKSDLTIGDIWNYDILPEEHSKGLSMIISNNPRGELLLKQSEVKTIGLRWNDVLRTNYRIAYGKGRIYGPRKNLQKNLARLPYKKLEQIYCLSTRPFNVGLFAFKAYRHVLYLLDQRKRQNYIKSLLKNNN